MSDTKGNLGSGLLPVVGPQQPKPLQLVHKVHTPSILAHDFTFAKSGCLVVRSEYYKNKRKLPKGQRFQMGIITYKSFYDDAFCGTVCIPHVHWEGADRSSPCHPANIKPLRSAAAEHIPMIEMEL